MEFIDFFAGIGGLRLGLERAGHKCVGFCEWDKYARKSYKAMFDTEGEWEHHDIRTASSDRLPKVDLWVGGFPCQDLSVAGFRKGLQEGERSGLFYEFIRLLSGLRKEDRPRWVLLENVKGLFSAGRGFDFLRCILELGQLGYSVEYQLLNSKDFGVPQNRERVFIVGYLGNECGRKVFPIRPTDGENSRKLQELTQGVSDACRIYDSEGLARTLKSEGGGLGAKMGLYAVEPMVVDAIFKNRPPRISDISPTLRSPARGLSVMVQEPKVIDAIYNSREPRVTDISPTLRADRQGLCVTEDIKVLGHYMPSGHEASRVLDPTGIAPTVMENHGTVNAVAIDLTENNPKITEIARCLQSRYNKGYSTRSAECSGVLVKPVLTPDREEKRQNGRRMKEDGEPMFTLTAQDKHGVAIIGGLQEHQKVRTDGISPCLTQAMGMGGGQTPCVLGTRIRKLTPRECWRLQGFPDEYFDKAVGAGVSNSQLYKQAGNAVTVNVAEAIGRRLRDIELGWLSKEEAEERIADMSQETLPKEGDLA